MRHYSTDDGIIVARIEDVDAGSRLGVQVVRALWREVVWILYMWLNDCVTAFSFSFQKPGSRIHHDMTCA
jgi:hypothetical protein